MQSNCMNANSVSQPPDKRGPVVADSGAAAGAPAAAASTTALSPQPDLLGDLLDLGGGDTSNGECRAFNLAKVSFSFEHTSCCVSMPCGSTGHMPRLVAEWPHAPKASVKWVASFMASTLSYSLHLDCSVTLLQARSMEGCQIKAPHFCDQGSRPFSANNCNT